MPARRKQLPAKPLTRPWAQFQANLTHVLNAFEDGDILILARHDANVFVQFQRGDNEMFLEAASNQYIDPPMFLLDERHFAAALALGWNAPTEVPHDSATLPNPDCDTLPYNGSPNFHQKLSRWNASTLAALAVQTLQRVYGVRRLDLLCYSSFKFDGGLQLRWPTLGVAHYDSIKHRNLTIPDTDDSETNDDAW